jgi:hypothetical protein
VLNVLHEFQEAVVVVVPTESLVVEEYGLSRQTETTAKMGYNFLSDRWIALKLLQYFSDAVSLEVQIESLLDEEEVLSSQTEITAEKGNNF